ncbi:hypothetical protein CABS02_15485 [Colletotrichum abscissum]|uniref:Uncharacterized protein n=1 Tax=Colletotrichum abscissum TaxID=1671311 RepID=A0A9P9WZ43_9PEZI|nr:hypothetical protein CABS02_15485 [Colletotrichum abscissum]
MKAPTPSLVTEDVARGLERGKVFTSPQEATQRRTRQDFGSELPPCRPFFSDERRQTSLPHLRELELFSTLSCIRDALLRRTLLRRSRARAPGGLLSPEPFFSRNGDLAPLAWLTNLTAVRSCGPDRLSVDLPTRETAPRGLRRSRRPSSQPRCNVPYTIEQNDFIAYFRDDLRLPWKTVEEQFAVVFPRDVNRGHRRRAPGLQGIYYRQNNRSSKQDSDGFLMLDSTDGSFASKRRCWGRGGKTTGSNGLLTTHPERAVNYAWVSVEHKTQCSIGCRKR